MVLQQNLWVNTGSVKCPGAIYKATVWTSMLLNPKGFSGSHFSLVVEEGSSFCFFVALGQDIFQRKKGGVKLTTCIQKEYKKRV